jgi:hypothetical protein
MQTWCVSARGNNAKHAEMPDVQMRKLCRKVISVFSSTPGQQPWVATSRDSQYISKTLRECAIRNLPELRGHQKSSEAGCGKFPKFADAWDHHERSSAHPAGVSFLGWDKKLNKIATRATQRSSLRVGLHQPSSRIEHWCKDRW